MKKRMLFIYNPKAGKAQIKSRLSDILDIFVKGGYEVIVHPTQRAGDALIQVQEYADDVDVIVCSGGDGTLDETVSGLMQCGQTIPVGYIPAGSTNDFASSLKIPTDMLEAAEDIVKGEVFPCDVGSFNQDTFVYIAAFGLFTDVSYQTPQHMKNILGHVAYVLEGMKRIFDIQSYWMKVTAGDKVCEGDYIYGMVTNSRSVGGFKNLTGKNVELDDGLFEVTLIKKPRNLLELNEILGALVTEVDNTQLIDTFKADWITVETMEPVSWTLDGEDGGNHPYVRIQNRKRAMKLLMNPEKREE